MPAGKSLFFPLVNSVNFDSPNVCGQGPENIPTEDLRSAITPFIDEVTNIVVEVDGEATGSIHRIGRSSVYAVALPEANVLDALCPGGVPAGVYSPAVDDELYIRLNPLEIGNHILYFHAEGPGGFIEDVTYNLTIVSVLQK